MRNDFKYVPTISLSLANDKARQRSKKTLITGAMIPTFLVGLWQAGVALFGLLVITNWVQIKSHSKGLTNNEKDNSQRKNKR